MPTLEASEARIHDSNTGIDLVAAEDAARDLLRALGVSTEDPDTRDTARRMVGAYAELFSSRPFVLTTFPNDENYNELVLVRDIPVRSVCEHHLLPFSGVAHVGYLPAERIVGLSKLARVVEHVASRPQVQERLTIQIASLLNDRLAARGIGVVIEAEHSCMTLRGAQARGSTTVTSALLGTLRSDPRSRQEFLSLARGTR